MSTEKAPPLEERVKSMTAEELREMIRKLRADPGPDQFEEHVRKLDILSSALVVRGLDEEGIDL